MLASVGTKVTHVNVNVMIPSITRMAISTFVLDQPDAVVEHTALFWILSAACSVLSYPSFWSPLLS